MNDPTETMPKLPVLGYRRMNKSRSKIDGLAERQRAFCHHYILGAVGVRLDARCSYFEAYDWRSEYQVADIDELYEKHRHKWMRCHERGVRLLQMPKIDAYLHKLRHQQQVQAEQTKPSWIAEAVKLRDQALKDKQYGPATSAHQMIGKALGHLAERIELETTPRTGDIVTQIGEAVSQNPQLAEVLAQAIGEDPEAKRLMLGALDVPIQVESTVVEPRGPYVHPDDRRPNDWQPDPDPDKYEEPDSQPTETQP